MEGDLELHVPWKCAVIYVLSRKTQEKSFVCILQDILASSVDTITVMLTWALSLLLNNPHALQKAQEEIDKQVGNDRQVDDSDINKLVYLQAIVKETLRLYPAAPLAAPRQFSEDCTLAGYHVPKGTWLMVNLWKIQHDPEIWPDPFEFRPERFLDETHMHVDVKGRNFELIPFSAGRRYCPGIGLTLQILHIVLATLLQNFDISTLNDEPVDMTESAGLINDKASPLEVHIVPRLPFYLKSKGLFTNLLSPLIR